MMGGRYMGFFDCELIDSDRADTAFSKFHAYPPEQARALIFAYAPNPHRIIMAELTSNTFHVELARRIEEDPAKWDNVKSSTLRWRSGEEREIETRNSAVLAILPTIARERLLEEINKRLGL
jgi:hypothetical protein